MVYGGMPSRGCFTCRKRKIKCDETHPSCLKCQKSGRTCGGYRSEHDLVFRNVTDAVKTKATSRSPSPLVVSPAVDLGAQTWLLPNAEDQATTVFFQRFGVTTPYIGVGAQRFNAAKASAPLQFGMRALAVRSLSKYDSRAYLDQKAASLYSKALSATQVALQDPKQVQDVEMVISVLLFIRYESLVSSRDFMGIMTRHMKGAVALVRARGEAWFQDEESLAVFRGLRVQMLTEALQSRERLEDFPGPRGWLGDCDESDSSPPALLIACEVEMTAIAHKAQPLLAKEKTPEAKAAVLSLLDEATCMQHRLGQWEAHLPPEWHPRTPTVATGSLPETGLEDLQVWPGPLHAHPTAPISNTRNHARALQILCGDIANGARAWLDPIGYSGDAAYQLTRNKVQECVDNICHSVTFHQWGHDLVDCIRPSGQDKIAGSVFGCLMLVWPLAAAYSAHGISDFQRCWLRGRLLAMSKGYGLEHAKAIVERCDALRIFVEPSSSV